MVTQAPCGAPVLRQSTTEANIKATKTLASKAFLIVVLVAAISKYLQIISIESLVQKT